MDFVNIWQQLAHDIPSELKKKNEHDTIFLLIILGKG